MGDGNHSLSLLKKAHYEVILDMVLQNLSSFNSYLNRKGLPAVVLVRHVLYLTKTTAGNPVHYRGVLDT